MILTDATCTNTTKLNASNSQIYTRILEINVRSHRDGGHCKMHGKIIDHNRAYVNAHEIHCGESRIETSRNALFETLNMLRIICHYVRSEWLVALTNKSDRVIDRLACD